MRKFIFVLLFFSFAKALTLEEAINKAIQNNPELQSIKQQLKSAEFGLKADESLYFPTFFTKASYQYYGKTPMTIIPNFPLSFKQSNQSFKTFNIGFNQTLYSGGQITSKVEASKHNLQGTLYLYKEKENQIKADVIKAYIDLFITASLIDIYKKELQSIESLYKQAEGFFQEGLITKVDLLQTKVRLAEVRKNLTEAQGNHKIAISKLSQLLGEEIKDEKFEPVKMDIPEKLDIKNLLEKENRPIVSYYRESIKQLENLEKIESAGFLPKLFIQGEYLYTNQSPYLDPKGNLLFTVGASIQFQGVAPYYKTLQAKSNTSKLRYDLQDTKEKIKLEIKTAYQNFLVAKENYKVSVENLQYAQEYFDLVKEQYANQLATNTDLLNAEAALTRALESKEINYYNLIKSYVDIKKAIGEDL
ncbi:MAG: TolC family protein [Hydrogenothermaceae bacterium]|nr:TolC family protein [Hydrogenothermaceae bacterium]